MKQAKLARLKFKGMREHVAELIRKAIFEGAFKPGELLRDADLAAQLNVSRAPVREALLLLENDSLVRNDYNRGWYVIELSKEEIAQITNVREILEAYALKLSVDRISDVQLRRLASIQRKLIKTCIDKNWVDLVARDFEFHRQIWESTGNPILLETLVKLTRPFFAYSQANLDSLSPELIELNIKAHQLLLDYLSKSVDLSAEACVAAQLRPREHPELLKLVSKSEIDAVVQNELATVEGAKTGN